MNGLDLSTGFVWLLAQDGAAFTVREFDLPGSPLGWLLLAGGGLLVTAWVVWLYRRDTVELSPFWKIWLTLLRVAALAGLLVIALNPHDRTQKDAFRPSRVGVLVDTSLSMRHPAESASLTGSVPEGDRTTRAEAVEKLLGQTKLIETLRQQHEVSIYSFDTALSGPHRVFSVASGQPGSVAAPSGTSNSDSPVKWKELLEPRGLESRLGESLSELVRQTAGRTLSGLIIITDGASNAGLDAAMAGERAASAKVKLLTVGVGGTEPPVNLMVSDIQAPSEVQKGDAYDITAFIQGQGFANRDAEVELLLRPDGEQSEPVVVERKTERILDDGVPVEVKFPRNPEQAGQAQYTVRVRPVQKIPEFDEQDNAQTFSVRVFDRPTRVLLVAGGPMRDYQFVRNMLHRHKSIDVDVYLQTATLGTSQESDNLLLAFPATKEELYEYDVIIAFDPDWELLPEDAPQLINDWVANEAGGLIFVAGDVNTPQFAALDGPGDGNADRFVKLKELYPVVLSSYFTAARFDSDTSQPWPIDFTSEGKTAGFLQLTDDPVSSAMRWKEFPGFYRCYPTSGAKAGATVFARFSDPRAQGDIPILMAAQFYGQGRTFYLGSPELWRLRSVSEDDYDRFWIKTVREVVQGRLKRGTKHGLLLPETRRVSLGQTVRIRSRLSDAQFKPLDVDSVRLEVYDPTGKPMVPPRQLLKDQTRLNQGEYIGDFRASLPGVYRLELPIPDTREQITEEVTVVLPKLEDENVRQNVQLLSQLAELTGGKYLPVKEAEAALPSLLPNRGELFKVDERLRTLWDRQWVLYALVGILSLEWLTRKLLKLS